jgi:hypothetical protein
LGVPCHRNIWESQQEYPGRSRFPEGLDGPECSVCAYYPTEIFSARRVHWMFNREFAGTGVSIMVPSFDPPRLYTRADWWKTEDEMLAFQNEILKYLYYRLKY